MSLEKTVDGVSISGSNKSELVFQAVDGAHTFNLNKGNLVLNAADGASSIAISKQVPGFTLDLSGGLTIRIDGVELKLTKNDIVNLLSEKFPGFVEELILNKLTGGK